MSSSPSFSNGSRPPSAGLLRLKAMIYACKYMAVTTFALAACNGVDKEPAVSGADAVAASQGQQENPSAAPTSAKSASDSPKGATPLAAPLAKPHRKLGVELNSLYLQRELSLLKGARQRQLLVKDGRLLVQVAYEGREEQLISDLETLQIPILQKFPKFKRLDIGLRSYTELDAVIAMGGVYRIEALAIPLSRSP